MDYNGLDIASMLQKFGKTQIELAKELGIERRSIGRYIKNGEFPSQKEQALKNIIEKWESEASQSHIYDNPVTGRLKNVSQDYSPVKEIRMSGDSDLELIKQIEDTEFRFIDDEHMLVICPYIDQYAYAGYLAGFNDITYSHSLPRAVFTLDELKFGVYRAFAVKGDSMDNGLKGCYSSGDVVYAKVLQRKYLDSPLQIRRQPDWIIVSKTEGIILKQIIAHDVKTGMITYHSLNPNFQDGQIHVDDILELLYVVFPKPSRRA